MNAGEQIFHNSLNAQKAVFFEQLQDGKQTICPCCDRHAQIYHRALNGGQAAQIIKLYRLGGQYGWIHSSAVAGEMGPSDFSKLQYWGLIEPKPNNENPDKKESGFYMLTEKGADFVKCDILVPSHVIVYNNTVKGYSEKQIGIIEALGNKFNYQHLMEGKL